MSTQHLWTYEVRLKGYLDASWVDEYLLNHFERVEVHFEAQGETTFVCRNFDQAALNALLNRLYALNVELISVIPTASK